MQMIELKFAKQLVQSTEPQVGSGAIFSTNRVQARFTAVTGPRES